MKKLLFLAAALLVFPGSGMTAQNFPDGLIMICTTADGIVTISEDGLMIADYHLRFDNIPADGLAHLADTRSNATAQLDARSDEGLYVEIREGGTAMLLVIDRNAIKYTFDKSATRPASPQLSSRFIQSLLDTRHERR